MDIVDVRYQCVVLVTGMRLGCCLEDLFVTGNVSCPLLVPITNAYLTNDA